jgi:hypothetical protein
LEDFCISYREENLLEKSVEYGLIGLNLCENHLNMNLCLMETYVKMCNLEKARIHGMLIDERTSYGNTFNCAKDPLVHEILRRTIEVKEIIRQINREMDWTSNLVGKYNLFNPEGFIDI